MEDLLFLLHLNGNFHIYAYRPREGWHAAYTDHSILENVMAEDTLPDEEPLENKKYSILLHPKLSSF